MSNIEYSEKYHKYLKLPMRRGMYLPKNWYGACWFAYHEKNRFFKHEVVGIIIGEQPFLVTILVGIHEAIHALFYTVFCFLNRNTMKKIQILHDWLWINAVFSRMNISSREK